MKQLLLSERRLGRAGEVHCARLPGAQRECLRREAPLKLLCPQSNQRGWRSGPALAQTADNRSVLLRPISLRAGRAQLVQGQVLRHVAEQDLVIAAVLQYGRSALLYRMMIISYAKELHQLFLNSWDFIAPYAY